MDFNGRHVVVTGGAGALGGGVVAALLEAGAVCHVPTTGDGGTIPAALRESTRVLIHPGVDLADAEAVDRLYERLPPLWASIHLAGGFAFGPLRDLDAAVLHRQIEINLVTCALCCQAALRAFSRGRNGGPRTCMQMLYAELLWIDRLGIYVRTEALGRSPSVVRVPFYRPVLDERDARSVLTMGSHITWDAEKQRSGMAYVPAPIPAAPAGSNN